MRIQNIAICVQLKQYNFIAKIEIYLKLIIISIAFALTFAANERQTFTSYMHYMIG